MLTWVRTAYRTTQARFYSWTGGGGPFLLVSLCCNQNEHRSKQRTIDNIEENNARNAGRKSTAAQCRRIIDSIAVLEDDKAFESKVTKLCRELGERGKER